MKKVLVADLIKASYDEFKDQRDLDILAEMDRSDVDEPTAAYLVDNWSNEADRDQVLQAAEDLGVDPQDVSDDDVEAMNSVSGSAVGKIDSTAGTFIYKLAIGTGLYYLWATFPSGKVVMYQNLEPDDINGIIDNGGAYYVSDIRIDSPEPDRSNPYVGCGCEHDPCSPAQIAEMPQI
jgi:hypothetical protein